MHDTYAGIDETVVFSPGDGHLTLRVQGNRRTQHVCKYDELESWVTEIKAASKCAQHTGSFNMFIARPVEIVSPVKHAYPLSKPALMRTLQTLYIPMEFANFAMSHSTVTMAFDGKDLLSVEEGEQPPVVTGFMSVLGPLAVALSHEAATNTTYAVAFGLCKHQALKLSSSVISLLTLSGGPMSLAVAWLEMLGDTRASRILGRRRSILASEIELGTHWVLNGQMTTLRDIPFQKLLRQLITLGSEIPWDTHATDAQLEMLDCVERLHSELASTTELSTGDTVKKRLEHIRSLLSGHLQWSRLNRDRINIQLQTVYSLLSQRDNEISYATAVASQRIAEAAQRDGSTMKAMAHDSRALAISSQNDSVNMRVMTFVNLITLPGTFVATFFSTTFFNFEPADGSMISTWIWLYVVFTMAVTLALLTIWYVSVRVTLKERNKQFHIYPEEDNTRRIQDTTSATLSASVGSEVEECSSETQSAPEGNPVKIQRPTAVAKNESRIRNEKAFTSERSCWDPDDTWHSQSFYIDRSSCAMCASRLS